jgi:hypothetical protein
MQKKEKKKKEKKRKKKKKKKKNLGSIILAFKINSSCSSACGP